MNQDNPIDKLVGYRIRRRRILVGNELGALASALGIAAARFQTIEAGRERVGAPLLIELVKLLGATPRFFFEDQSVSPVA